MLLKRVLAWIALIFFIFIVVNILFIHVYVTESATVFLIYALVFLFGSKRNLFQSNPMQQPDGEIPGQPETPDISEDSGSDGETDGQENKHFLHPGGAESKYPFGEDPKKELDDNDEPGGAKIDTH